MSGGNIMTDILAKALFEATNPVAEWENLTLDSRDSWRNRAFNVRNLLAEQGWTLQRVVSQ